MVSSQLCPSSFHNQSYTGSETRDFGSRVVMDGTILNSLCLLTHIGQSIQPSLSNGTSANYQDRILYAMQYFHGTEHATKLGLRAMALIWNFHPYSRKVQAIASHSQSPFENLNGFRPT